MTETAHTDAPEAEAPAPAETAPTPMEPITEATDLEGQLAVIQEELGRQLGCLEEEDYDGFDDSCRKVAPILQAVTAAKCEVTPKAFAHVREIRKLHQQVGLKLADQSAAAAKALDRVRAGKNMVKAYKS